MQRWRGLLRVHCGCACALAAALVASCREPTEVRLVLSSDLRTCPPLPGAKSSGTTTITVGADLASLSDGPGTTTDTCTPASPGSIGELVLVPSGDRGAQIAIEIVAGLGKEACAARVPGTSLAGCVVARRRLRFVPHTSLELPVELRQECAGVSCPPEETCIAGGSCAPALCADAACSNLRAPNDLGRLGPDASADARADGTGAPDAVARTDATAEGGGGAGDGGPCGPLTAGIDCASGGPCAAPSQQCCNGVCKPAGDLCSGRVTSTSVACDETADCPPGKMCCLHNSIVNLVFTQCETSCAGDPMVVDQVCKQDCECGAGSCTGSCNGGMKTCGGQCPVPQ